MRVLSLVAFFFVPLLALAQDKPAPKPAEAERAAAPSPEPKPAEPANPPRSPQTPAPAPEAAPPSPSESPAARPDEKLEDETILGGDEERQKIAGSASSISEEQLQRFEYDDINRVLRSVPGVNIREEDGYGLRPNIGLRGVNPDRSSKIVLMEDGVLLAPAPYSAPAAYYFPLTTRASKIEVFKGPSAIRYGPNTIGGAINIVTRPIPEGFHGALDIAGGSFQYRKAHLYASAANEYFGALIEGVSLGAGGFKEIDGGGNAGFVKNEGMIKLRANTDPEAHTVHQFDIKMGLANEQSQETYLGVSDFDFRLSPYRRYIGSRFDRFDWLRSQMQVGYTALFGEDFELNVTAYRNDFQRNWRRLSRFRNGPDIRAVLANPSTSQNAVFFQVLTGQQDSANLNQSLMITDNGREFISQGLQSRATARFSTGDVEHELTFGARLHFDSIRRDHDEEGFNVVNGQLIADGLPSIAVTRNTGEALASAFYLAEEMKIGDLTLTPGLRLEYIRTDFVDHLTGRREDADDLVILPGLGAFYQFFEGFGVLAGVYRGFSPVSPGNTSNVDPEFSINSEAGLRLWNKNGRLELIGFFNHYSELISEATFSSGASSATIGQQTNGGEVNIYGLELAAGYDHPLNETLTLSLQGTYTLTISEFLDTFVSSDPVLGVVLEGERLPNVPRHQGSLTLGISGKVESIKGGWSLFGTAAYVGKVFETTARRNVPASETINDYTVVDVAASLTFFEHHQLYFKVDNVLDEAYLVSRRPFGARPGKPRVYTFGYKFDW